MSALIGALRVSLSADTADFQAGLRRAQAIASSSASGIQKSFGLIKGALGALGIGLSVGLFVNAIKGALEYAGSLAEVAQQVGVTTKDLQTFRFAAGQVGISQEALETGLSKLTITLGKVAVGADAPTKALKAIGLAAKDVAGLDAGAAFRKIADGMKNVSDRSQRAAVEVALFGKSGAQLDNLLSGGSATVNELSDAAERLGIVLSDEQIRRADDTADKLTALKTVLSANIASAVADNASSILSLAGSLVTLIASMGDAIRGWHVLQAELSVPLNTREGFVTTMARAGRAAQFRDRIMAMGGKPAPVVIPKSADVGNFLAGGGGKSKNAGGADHSAEDKLRDQNAFDQELRRSQIDVLRAQQDLASDYVERTTIGIEILNAEKAARDAEHDYQVALYALTKGKQGQSAAQVAQIKAQEDIKDGLEREKLLQDEQTKRQEDVAKLVQGDLDRRKEALEAQAAIATTASERRKIELELLRIAYEQKQQALQNTIDTSKDAAEVEGARRDLGVLNATYGADRQGVLNQTRGPLEEWAASVPHIAAQINEALQSIEVQGLEGLSDAIADVISGTKSLGEAFGEVAKGILADLIRMSIRMLIFRALSGIMGGGGSMAGVDSSEAAPAFLPGGLSLSSLPPMANGGSFSILGRGGTDRNIMAINGVPMARVNRGEMVTVGDANSGGSFVINQTIAPNFAGNAATQQDLVKMGLIAKQSAIEAMREERRRA